MRTTILSTLAVCAGIAMGATSANAQAVYGETINLEQARKAIDGAVAEAKKNNWMMAITVVGPSGDLVYFAKMDNTQYGSIAISQGKVGAAAFFRRTTKSFEERIGGGGMGLTALTLDGVIASEGGIPVAVGGKIIGAIGCSGGTSQQDGQACQAGADSL